MVGPISAAEHQSLVGRLKVAFVVLIGVSSGLITLLGEPTLLESALVVAGSLLFGALVVRIVFPNASASDRDER